MRSSSSSSSPSFVVVEGGGGGAFDCSSSSCSRSRAVSENLRSTLDLVSINTGVRVESKEVVRYVHSATDLYLFLGREEGGGIEPLEGVAPVPLGFLGGSDEVACFCVAFVCFLDVRWASYTVCLEYIF